jgi:hypothetical protein
MAEEIYEEETTTEEVAAAPVKAEEKIMCFVSKQMVPVSQTVEIEYMPHKKVRVLPRYIKYQQEA